MDENTTTGLWPPESIDVRSTSPNLTQLREEVLPPSRCLSIQRGHHTLTRGRNYNPLSRKAPETSLTSYRILLGNVHPNWMKLWYLQQRIASRDEGIVPPATIPSLDQRTLHDPNQSRESHILEGSQEIRSKTCPLAHRPRRIQLQNDAHTQEYEWPSGRTITSPRNWQRGEWQPRHCNDSPTPHQNSHHTRVPIRPILRECPIRTS